MVLSGVTFFVVASVGGLLFFTAVDGSEERSDGFYLYCCSSWVINVGRGVAGVVPRWLPFVALLVWVGVVGVGWWLVLRRSAARQGCCWPWRC
jgi:hypothetical protein